MPDIVVEVSGGTVVEIYTDMEDARLVLIDWDNIQAGDRGTAYPAVGLGDLPEKTKHEYHYAIEEHERASGK